MNFAAGTERAFSGKTTNGFPHDNKASGVYVGAVGGLPLFSSDTKFDSGALGRLSATNRLACGFAWRLRLFETRISATSSVRGLRRFSLPLLAHFGVAMSRAANMHVLVCRHWVA